MLQAGMNTVIVLAQTADRSYQVARLLRKALGTVAHPEEPEDPFISYCSQIAQVGQTGAKFWFDGNDLEAYPEVVADLAAAIGEVIDSQGLEPSSVTLCREELTFPPAPSPPAPFVLPTDFPLPPDAQDFEVTGVSGDGRATFRSALPQYRLIDWWRQELPRLGYQLKDHQFSNFLADTPGVTWQIERIELVREELELDVVVMVARFSTAIAMPEEDRRLAELTSVEIILKELPSQA